MYNSLILIVQDVELDCFYNIILIVDVKPVEEDGHVVQLILKEIQSFIHILIILSSSLEKTCKNIDIIIYTLLATWNHIQAMKLVSV